MTEPAAGSNPQAILSTATPAGDGAWTLRGTKCWSGTAGWASVINVFAQNLDVDGQPRGVSGFVVPRDTPGVRMGPEALTLGMRAMVQNTVHLDGARVTHAQRLGETGGGMRVAQDAMLQGRLAIGAASVGGIKRCLQLLVRYAERRTISTGRLLDNPVLLDRAAAVGSALAGLESLVATVGGSSRSRPRGAARRVRRLQGGRLRVALARRRRPRAVSRRARLHRDQRRRAAAARRARHAHPRGADRSPRDVHRVAGDQRRRVALRVPRRRARRAAGLGAAGGRPRPRSTPASTAQNGDAAHARRWAYSLIGHGRLRGLSRRGHAAGAGRAPRPGRAPVRLGDRLGARARLMGRSSQWWRSAGMGPRCGRVRSATSSRRSREKTTTSTISCVRRARAARAAPPPSPSLPPPSVTAARSAVPARDARAPAGGGPGGGRRAIHRAARRGGAEDAPRRPSIPPARSSTTASTRSRR